MKIIGTPMIRKFYFCTIKMFIHKFCMKKLYPVLSFILLALFAVSCKKEYITNEYVTNITNQYITNNDSVYIREFYSVVLSRQREVTREIMPAYLQAGDSVAICATSNSVTEAELKNGIAILQSWGLNVLEADNLYDVNGRFAGTLARRIDGLQKLIDNRNIKAIIAARGGYGAVQLFPFLDFRPLENHPKWMVGFSDITVMHAAMNNLGFQTIHGAMVNNFSNNTSVTALKQALFGEMTELSIPTTGDCIQGVAEGRLVGGNLTSFYGLGGTIIDLNVKGAILFIEDTGEAHYNVDRMLKNLKLSGKLDAVRGIVVGQFMNMTQGIDLPLNKIISDNVRDLGIPVMYGVPVGHGSPNMPLYLGRTVRLEVEATTSRILF